ncbi:MAG: ATP-binding protein [Filifactoraceae bacterium]
MNKKQLISYFLIVFSLISLMWFYNLPIDKENNYAEINHVVKTIEENWNGLESVIPSIDDIDKSFYVIDRNNKIIYISGEQKRSSIEESIKNKDTIIDIVKNDMIVGKVIFINDDYYKFINHYKLLKIIYTGITVVCIVSILALMYRFWKTIMLPLEHMTVFAERISDGNLEMPLIIHSNDALRNFANSFDIMREKLLISQMNQQNAMKKRKELIASLSHDIKTPIATIKAISELLSIQEEDELKRKKIMLIIEKAEQISLLASNLLQSTLDELEEMKIILREEHSDTLIDIIRSSDYKNYVKVCYISPCIIRIDKNQMLQVFDNVINNSYKYADTEIIINSYFIEHYLRVITKDFGNSIEKDELVLVTEKFYRGTNAKKNVGSGLGLYICKNIIEKSGGRISFERSDQSFNVILDLPLA